MTSKSRRSCGGFTLVEVLLYALFVGALLLVFATFIIETLLDRTRSKNAIEVQQNARVGAERMAQAIRAAKAINATATSFDINLALPENAGKGLSLQMATPALDPTIFAVTGNILQIREGTAATTSLVSDEVKVTNLTFTNYSTSTRVRNVGLELTVGMPDPTVGAIYAVSTTLRTTAELRNR